MMGVVSSCAPKNIYGFRIKTAYPTLSLSTEHKLHYIIYINLVLLFFCLHYIIFLELSCPHKQLDYSFKELPKRTIDSLMEISNSWHS